MLLLAERAQKVKFDSATASATVSWRDNLLIHPAVELFPPMSSDELRALGEDIVKNGFTSPIVLWRARPNERAILLDGRSRLDATEMATGRAVEVDGSSVMAGEFLATNKVIVLDGRSVDPWAYAISANIRRRHLTIEDTDRLTVELLKADPTKSSRQVAKIVGASRPHVAKVRRQAEQAGHVETVSTTVDTKGRGNRRSARETRLAPCVRSLSAKWVRQGSPLIMMGAIVLITATLAVAVAAINMLNNPPSQCRRGLMSSRTRSVSVTSEFMP